MSQLHVLIAEDNPDHALLARLAMTERRARVLVTVVSRGAQLLSAIAQNRCDCILLDFNLPDTSADELVPKLAERGCDCPVVVMSSSEEQGVVIRSLRCGGVDFVPKSDLTRPGVLWARVCHAIAAWRRARGERRKAARRTRLLVRRAETDPLTGLPNRLCLRRRLRDHRRTAERRARTAVLIADIDHFKDVNDTHGHLVGDEVLRLVASTLQAARRSEDLVCRWGGEEFVVIQFGTTAAQALAWAEDVRERLAAAVLRTGTSAVHTTISIGVAMVPPGPVMRTHLAQADAALYLAKRLGRNRTCTWELARFENLASSLAGAPSSATAQPGSSPANSPLADGAADGATNRTAGNATTSAPVGSLGGDSPAAPPPTDPEARLARVLAQYGDELGPTQRLHVQTYARHASALAVALGLELGLSQSELDAVRLAARLHDLGKLGVPEEILTQTTPLGNAERVLLTHAAADSARMASWLGASPAVCDLIQRQHSSRPGVSALCGSSTSNAFVSADDATSNNDSTLPGDPSPAEASSRAEAFSPSDVSSPTSSASVAATVLRTAVAFVAMVTPRAYQSLRTPSAALRAVYGAQRAAFNTRVAAALVHLVRSHIPSAGRRGTGASSSMPAGAASTTSTSVSPSPLDAVLACAASGSVGEAPADC